VNADGKRVVSGEGCRQKIKYGARHEHEAVCEFAPAQCPYSDCCPPLTRAQLTQHMNTCSHIPCPHKVAGCTFEGTKGALDEHMENCGYESIKDYIARNEEQLTSMKQLLEDKTAENDFLRKSIIQLTSRFDQLAIRLEAKNSMLDGDLGKMG
jgi:E3 ubiquitin-protein ligase TRAF7